MTKAKIVKKKKGSDFISFFLSLFIFHFSLFTFPFFVTIKHCQMPWLRLSAKELHTRRFFPTRDKAATWTDVVSAMMQVRLRYLTDVIIFITDRNIRY